MWVVIQSGFIDRKPESSSYRWSTVHVLVKKKIKKTSWGCMGMTPRHCKIQLWLYLHLKLRSTANYMKFLIYCGGSPRARIRKKSTWNNYKSQDLFDWIISLYEWCKAATAYYDFHCFVISNTLESRFSLNNCHHNTLNFLIYLLYLRMQEKEDQNVLKTNI